MTAGAMPNPAAALHEYLQSTRPEQKMSIPPPPCWGRSSQPPSPLIELEDVELTSVPLMVYFKLLVRPVNGKGPAHHVMKTFRDLQDLDEALSRELPGSGLPRLPTGRTQKELTESAFCARLGAYLASLASSAAAPETYSFKNFFQLSDEYQRWLPQSQAPPAFESGIVDEAKWQALPSAAVPALALPAASSASPSGMATRLSGLYRTESPGPMLSARSQPAERMLLAAGGSPIRTSSGRIQTEAPRVLLRPAAAPVPRAPEMPQTAPEMPRAAAPPAEEAVGSRSRTPTAATATSTAESRAEVKREPHVSQSFSSDELGSSVETSAGGKRHRRRRPWCVVCMANPQEMAIDPCGHMSMCHRCAAAVQACPVCRGPIGKALRVYMA